MRPISAICIFGVLLIGSWCSGQNEAYIEINDNTFEKDVNDGREWLIVAQSPTCEGCSIFKNELDMFLGSVNEYVNDLNIGLLDVHSNPGTASRLLISYIPSIYHYRNKELRYLNKHYSYKNLTRYFENQEWTTMEKRSDIVGPFSLFGMVLSRIGIMGFYLSRVNGVLVMSALVGILIIMSVVVYVLNNGKGKNLFRKKNAHKKKD